MSHLRHPRLLWLSMDIAHKCLSYRLTILKRSSNREAQFMTKTRQLHSTTTSTRTTMMSFSRSRSTRKCLMCTTDRLRSRISKYIQAASLTTAWPNSCALRVASRTKTKTRAAIRSQANRRWYAPNPCLLNSLASVAKQLRMNKIPGNRSNRLWIRETKFVRTILRFKTSMMSQRQWLSSLTCPIKTTRAKRQTWAKSCATSTTHRTRLKRVSYQIW